MSALRALRLLRVLKLVRRVKSLQLLSHVVLEDWLFEPEGACRVCARAKQEHLLCDDEGYGEKSNNNLNLKARLKRRRRRMAATFRAGAKVLVHVASGEDAQRATVVVAQRANGNRGYRAQIEWYFHGQWHSVVETGGQADGFVVEFNFKGRAWRQPRPRRPSVADYLCPDEATTLARAYGVEEEPAEGVTLPSLQGLESQLQTRKKYCANRR